MKSLTADYNKKRRQIKKRLKEFEALRNGSDEDIFQELCFCLLTPQTKAVFCDRAVKDLKSSGLLFTGTRSAISKRLKGRVRFHNNKAAYLVAARRLLSAQGGSLPVRQAGASGGKNGKSLDIKGKLDTNDTLGARDWLVRSIKGLGYKEASHFLRNIGLGRDIAIIDRHILENLRKHRVINRVPASISRKRYIGIEDKMRKFSHRIKVPLEELDLLFWSEQTGFIFK